MPDIMNEFPQIERRLPYKESDSYIDNLLTKCADKAIASQSKPKPAIVRLKWMWTAAASLLVAATLGFVYLNSESEFDRISKARPLDEVLADINEEDIEMFDNLSAINIPEDY